MNNTLLPIAVILFNVIVNIRYILYGISYSRAVKLLSGKEHTDLERELNKIYRLILESQDRLLALKGMFL